MRDHIVLYVNGIRRTVDIGVAQQTLSEFLRSSQHPPHSERLTGTKIACAEGDCGACTVLVGKPTADGKAIEYQSVDACIAFVFQMDCRHVVSVEGLRTCGGLSEVQKAMVDGHGSQCGFCTPGFVMALHGLAENTGNDSATSLEDEDVRLGLSGNLCRCTGYMQILHAATSLPLEAVALMSGRFDESQMLTDFAKLGGESVRMESSVGKAVAIPRCLSDLVRFRTEMPTARLVAGATDLGVQRNHGRFEPDEVITTCEIPELQTIAINDDELVVGAAATWQEIDEFIGQRLPEYHQILLRFGSPQIRHVGTLAGNLANASPIADSIPFHFVTETIIEVASSSGARSISIADFYHGYKQIDLAADEVITRVRTPLPPPDVAVKLYKVSKRRDMDISTVTAAFWLQLDGETIADARVAVGGVGPVVLRLPKAEQSLVGSLFELESLQAAGTVARSDVAPICDVRGSADYRLLLVENLFAKCYYDLSANLSLAAN